MEVRGAVSCHVHPKEGCIAGRLGVFNVDHLHVEFKAPMALVPSQLYPQLGGWDGAVMPSETSC